MKKLKTRIPSRKWKNRNQILNSYLTPKGVYQARRIYYQYLRGILSKFESVSYVCSSLDRTIETLINAVSGYTFSNGESFSSEPEIKVGHAVIVTPGLKPKLKGEQSLKISNEDSSVEIIDQTSITFPGKITSIDSDKKTCTVEYTSESKIKFCLHNVPFARIISSSHNDDIEKFKKKFDDIRLARGLIPDELKIVEPVEVEPVEVEPPAIATSAAGKRIISKTLKKRPTRRHNRRKLVSTSKKFLPKKKRTRVKNYPLKKLKSVSRKR